jgi:hypothetical protein
LTKIVDILDRIDKVEQAEAPLYQRFISDYKLWRGEPYAPEAGYKAFTDNTAEVQGHKSILLMGRARNHIYIPIDEDKKGRRKKKSLTERFYSGYLDAANALRRARLEPDIQSEMAWHAFVRGWIVVIPLIYKDKDGKTVVDCIFWDRLHTRYERSQNGLKWAAYVMQIKAREVESMFGVKPRGRDGEDLVKVVYYYDEEKNGLILDETWHKKLKPHQIGFNPVIVIPCGPAPYIFSPDIADPVKDQGESGFKGMRNMIEPVNAMKSAYYTNALRYRKPPFVAESVGGNLEINEDVFKEGTWIPLDPNLKQAIKPLELPELPKDAAIVTQDMSQQLANALPAFPYTGQLGATDQSGLALNIMEHATTTVLFGEMMGMEITFEEMGWSVTRQFSSKDNETNLGLEPIELRFYVENGMELHEFKPDEVKPYRFKSEIEIEMPRNEMEKWMQARMAREPMADGRPMLPEQYVLENIIKVPDVDLVLIQKDEEFARNLPTVKLRQTLWAMIERGSVQDSLLPTLQEMILRAPSDVLGDVLHQLYRRGLIEAAAISVFLELKMMEAKQQAELMKTLMPPQPQMPPGQMGPGQQGAMAPQPMQAPDQGMNPGAAMPMQGMPPGFTPPMAQSPGMVMSPEQEMAIRAMMMGSRGV